MDKNEFLRLLDRYLNGSATAEEVKILNQYFESYQSAQSDWDEEKLGNREELSRSMSYRLITSVQSQPQKVSLWHRIAIPAAAVLLLTLLGSLFYRTVLYRKEQIVRTQIMPGTVGAILKTSDGKTIYLDNIKNGRIADRVEKTSATDLQMDNDPKSDGYTTVEVPAGAKTLKIRLTDGSEIILNAQTVIKIPHQQRNVQNHIQLITGEAYFNVTHNPHAPLNVSAGNQLIEDIGTKFNVSFYPHEETKTILIDGAVRIGVHVLKPGQQAVDGNLPLSLTLGQQESTLAWIKGDFSFNGEQIEVIMKQLSRWYNVEVAYINDRPKEGLYGRITRTTSLEDVLKLIERTNQARFKIQGRRVLVWSK